MVSLSVFGDPSWFPDRLDWRHRLVRMVQVRRETLRDSPFLDGRTPLADEPPAICIVPLEDFIAGLDGRSGDARWILHESYCGSTLLAQALAIEPYAMCLKEPQILVDLANWKAVLGRSDLYDAAIRAVVAKLSQRWPDNAPIVIKPSNWANTIAADLLAASVGEHAAIVAIEPERFLIAVLRGGRDRLRHMLELREHLALAEPALASRVAEIDIPHPDRLTEAMGLVTQTFWIQRTLLRHIFRRSDGVSRALRFPEWLASPIDNLKTAQLALCLAVPTPDIEFSVEQCFRNYSKDSGISAFERSAEDAANEAVRERYRSAIDTSLALLACYDQIDVV